MTKEEAAYRLKLKFDYFTSVTEALAVLDFIENPEEGLGMYPPMTKKGKFEWSQEDNQEQIGTK